MIKDIDKLITSWRERIERIQRYHDALDGQDQEKARAHSMISCYTVALSELCETLFIRHSIEELLVEKS
jgi:hypothetical protein